MTPWKHNNAPHRNALNFGKPDANFIRWAKHAKGVWSVRPSGGLWKAGRGGGNGEADLGLFPTEGLAMSRCARDCKDQP